MSQEFAISGSSRRSRVQFLCHSAAAVLLLSMLVLVSACSKRYNDLPVFSPIPFKDYENESVGRFKTSYLVEQFDNYYRGTSPGPIGVTTFVNLDDLYTTSSFGRMLSEQVMSELTMRGFDVIELRHADALQFLSAAGEFALSRDLGFVRRERELGGVVVGTYVASPLRVYVNARLLDPTSSRILTVGSVEMAKTNEIARLLRGGSIVATLERIPVKHIGFSSYPLNVFGGGSRMHELEDPAPSNSNWLDPIAPRLQEPLQVPDKGKKGLK
ncbi:MAG: hypothetical protein J5J00_15725 [Deltaproteobacteria bacterium]|nr:hypothetical protein [Deltaproteobacteria bacterium]